MSHQAGVPGRPDRAVERWLRAEVASAAGSDLRRATVLGALAAAFAVPQAWLLAHAVAPAVMEKAPLAWALSWLLPVLPLLAVRFGLAAWSGRTALAAAGRVKARIRSGLLRDVPALAPDLRRASGEVAAAVLEGVDALDAYVSRFLAHLGVLVILPPLILIVVLPRDWISALVLLSTAPVIPLFMVLLGNGAARLNRRQWQRLARLSGRLLDGLQRLTTLRMLNAGEREAERLAEAAEDYRRSTMAVLRVAFLSALALEFFATVGIALVAVLIGFRLLDGTLGFEAGLFVLLLAPEFYAPLRQLGLDYHARMEALAAAERIFALQGARAPPPGDARPTLGRSVTIDCVGVGFAWEPGRPTLEGVSLRLLPGEIVALIGPSGAGKSTVLNMIPRFYDPTAGRVLIDGHDLREVSQASLRAQLAIVPQDTMLFGGTVRENILYGKLEASEDELIAAALAANAHAFILALPQGYDTVVGERGAKLSGGQRQRIAIARAILKDPRVLLLDEATSSLDSASEQLVQEALERLMQSRTTVIIAHRLSTVKVAHRIAVLEAGQIVELGTHAELIALGGLYSRLYAMQFREPEQLLAA